MIADPNAAGSAAYADHNELLAELHRIGLDADLGAFVLKPSATSTVRLTGELILLPMNFLKAAFSEHKQLDHEFLAMGLRGSIALLRPHGATLLLAESLLSLSRCTRGYVSLEASLELTVEAMKVLRACAATHRMARAYLELAINLKDGNAVYDALSSLDQSVALGRKNDDPGVVAAAHYEQGAICRRLGIAVAALDYFASAKHILPALAGGAEWVERISSEETACQIELGREVDALHTIQSWIEAGATTHRPYMYRGDIKARNGDAARALDDYIDGCIVAGRAVRTSVSDRYRRTDTRRAAEIFDRGVVAAVIANQPEMAFGLAELANAGSSPFEPIAEDSTPASNPMLEGQADLLVARAQEARSSNDLGRLQACQEDADWLIGQADLMRRPKAEPAISRDVLVSWSSRLQAALPADSAVLQFVEAEDQVFVFFLTAKRLVASPTGLSSLEARLLGRSVTHEIRGQFPTNALNVLGARLLGPVKDGLEEVAVTTIVPSPALYGLPFQAMSYDQLPLIATHCVLYESSAKGALERSKPVQAITKGARWSGLGVPEIGYASAPRLSFIAPELTGVAKQFVTPRLTIAPPATSADLFSLISCSDVLHLACHGAFEPAAPLLSHLFMADRPVFAFEMLLRRQGRGLVVLSACDTARAQSDAGGYAQSLASAFLGGGAHALVATLWPLDDRSAAVAMQSFYVNLLSPRAPSIGEALRDAQRELRLEDPHPYFWSSFAAFGAGRAT
jgi:CHAT domain-containing protein